MELELIETLACPVCKGDLELKATEETGQEIINGSLGCPRCQVLYPVEVSIPNILSSEAWERNRGKRGVP